MRVLWKKELANTLCQSVSNLREKDITDLWIDFFQSKLRSWELLSFLKLGKPFSFSLILFIKFLDYVPLPNKSYHLHDKS